jgi:Pol polyprotein, beta-barrel domain
MTPHRDWLHNYKDHHVRIRLANNDMIYSVGRGDIFFKPIIDGRSGALIKLSDILHVPALQNNLLTILRLSTHEKFEINIRGNQISFALDGKPRLQVTIHNGI